MFALEPFLGTKYKNAFPVSRYNSGSFQREAKWTPAYLESSSAPEKKGPFDPLSLGNQPFFKGQKESLPMTPRKWGHDPLILGNDQPFFKGQKETLGRYSRAFSDFC